MPEEKKLLNNCIQSMSTMELFLKSVNVNDPSEIAKGTKYYDWVNNKTEKIITEDNLNIPVRFIPSKIDEYTYTKSKQDIKTLVTKYYNVISNGEIVEYVRNESKIVQMTKSEIEKLVYSLVLIPKKVIWVDFGFNIGAEFGGHHPALIIKKAGRNVIVLPISSGTADSKKNYNVNIPMIYKFPEQRPRWVSIHRMKSISPKRIDFNGSVGSVKTAVFNDLKKRIRNEYV